MSSGSCLSSYRLPHATSVSTGIHGTLTPAGLTPYPVDMCSASSKRLVVIPASLRSLIPRFCFKCLSTITPRTCPLCRRPFHLTRACKLHVDVADAEHGYYVLSATELKARKLEEQVAYASTEDVVDDDCQSVIDKSLAWLEGAPSDSVSLHFLHFFVP